jgi:hypothetical protein
MTSQVMTFNFLDEMPPIKLLIYCLFYSFNALFSHFYKQHNTWCRQEKHNLKAGNCLMDSIL